MASQVVPKVKISVLPELGSAASLEHHSWTKTGVIVFGPHQLDPLTSCFLMSQTWETHFDELGLK